MQQRLQCQYRTGSYRAEPISDIYLGLSGATPNKQNDDKNSIFGSQRLK